MTNSNKLVSIITPVFNSSRFINETYLTLKNQIYYNWEWLVVDDCSSDDSMLILEDLAKIDSRIKLFYLKKNSGSGIARNLAIKNAKGKYIAFLDSDDLWEVNKLERQILFMHQNNATFCHTSYDLISESGISLNKIIRVSNRPVSYNMLLKNTEISCLTAMYDQEKIGKYYMPNLRRKQDYALWLSILKDGHKSIPLDEVLGHYRQVSTSATHQKHKLIIKHYYFMRESQNLSIFNSVRYTLYWGLNGFVKYFL